LTHSNLPAGIARAGRRLLGLAGGGVCRAGTVTDAAVRSYRTISPLPFQAVYFLWHCPFPINREVAVSHHRALSCSDFPPAKICRRLPDPLYSIDN